MLLVIVLNLSWCDLTFVLKLWQNVCIPVTVDKGGMAAVSVDNCRNLASDFLLGKQIAGKFHSLFQLQEEKAK